MVIQDSDGTTRPAWLAPTPADERREYGARQKLVLEYLKLLVSLGLVGTVIFAGLQWKEANTVADQTVYQRISADWKEHLTLFVEKPQLAPYFEGKKVLAENDPLRDSVLAAADLRLHAIDSIFTYFGTRWSDSEFPGWNETVRNAFRNSPVLCTRFLSAKETWDEEVINLANENCEPNQASPPHSN
jgi:hypothetical protein